MSSAKRNENSTPKKHSEKERKFAKGVLIYLVVLCVFFILLSEYDDSNIMTTIITVVTSLLPFFLGALKNEQNQQEVEEYYGSVVDWIVKCIQKCHKSLYFSVFLCVLTIISIVSGIVLGKLMVVERFQAAIEAFFENPREDDEESTQESNTQLEKNGEKKEETSENTLYYANEENSEEEKDSYQLKQMEPLIIDVDDLSEYILLEKELEEVLEEVLFLGETYKELDWKDGIAVECLIDEYIKDITEKNSENIFDKDETEGGADVTYCNKLLQLNNRDESVRNFSEQFAIMQERIEIYDKYPKSSIASAISDDAQLLAYSLYISGEDEDAIMYFYVQAIHYRIEKLSYCDVKNVEDELAWIAKRYRDINRTCLDNEWSEYISILETVYGKLSEKY